MPRGCGKRCESGRRWPLSGLMCAGGLLSILLASSAVAQTSRQPDGWKKELALAEAVDRNADPRVVEIDLEARVATVDLAPGLHVEAWTYDGGLPGPLIHARVGDRLIVHFVNHLPQPTTIHWHGVRLPIAMDGVPGVSQPEVQPGGTFTYDFILPDAGLFWYHPHVMSEAQVGFGLYGALLIDDPTEQLFTDSSDIIDSADQLVLVLSDIAIDDDGKLEAPDSSGDLGNVFGREGNYVLVNGRRQTKLVVRSGAPQRWRIVNASKSRYYDLVLLGQSFTKIGVDGGRLEYPVEADRLVVAAGERVDAIVTPRAAPGTELLLISFPADRGYGSVENRDMEPLLTMTIADLPPATFGGKPAGRSIEPLQSAGATKVDLRVTLTSVKGKSEMAFNGLPFWKAPPIHANLGETQLWTIKNSLNWAHPIHLHGFFFQVVDEQGVPVRPLAWRDTVNVPVNGTLRFLVRFDDRPGMWMFHCHILDHAAIGMMGMVEVGPPSGDTAHEHR